MIADFDLTGVLIETERLILREWNINDLDDIYEYAKVPGVGKMAGWPAHESIEISREILNTFISEKKVFAIVLKDENKAIGSIGIEKFKFPAMVESPYKGREIGYVLNKDYWGKGIMPEACKGVISYLFDKLDYDFLLCGHFLWNSQSARVIEKCGFVYQRDFKHTTLMGYQEDTKGYILWNPNKSY